MSLRPLSFKDVGYARALPNAMTWSCILEQIPSQQESTRTLNRLEIETAVGQSFVHVTT